MNPQSLTDRLSYLKTLKDGWLDGAESKAVFQTVCDLVEHVLPKLYHGRPEHKPHVYPTPDGGIEVEVDLTNFSYGLEFTPTGSIELTCSYWKQCADKPQDLELELSGLSPEDYVVVIDDWIKFL